MCAVIQLRLDYQAKSDLHVIMQRERRAKLVTKQELSEATREKREAKKALEKALGHKVDY